MAHHSPSIVFRFWVVHSRGGGRGGRTKGDNLVPFGKTLGPLRSGKKACA